MNFINYNIDTFRSSDINHRREWDNATEKVLLRLIIETGFYAKHAAVDNAQKLALWSSLHHDFCHHPDVIEYAATSSGQVFTQKYENVQYVKAKFRRMKADFRKVVADVRRTGSGGLPPESRYEHFDDMKDITLGDPSFWPSTIRETDCIRDGRFAGLAIYTLRPDGCSYDVSFIEKPEFLMDARIGQSVGFVPTPETAPPAPSAPSAMAEGRGRLRINEAIERLIGNSTRVNANVEEGLSRMLGEFRQTRGLVEVAVEDMRRRDEAASEARRLDRQMWERIAETDFELREKEMRCREKIAELKRLSRQTSSQSSSSNNTNK